MPRPTMTRRPPAGISLLELLITTAVIGVLIAFALPRIPVRPAEADASARSLRGLLLYAQRTAAQKQASVVVGFDIARNRLRVHEDLDSDRVVDEGETVREEVVTDREVFAVPRFKGINGSPVTAAVRGGGLRTIEQLPSVVFRPDGTASSNLEIYLGSRDGRATNWRAVTLVGATGRTDLWTASREKWSHMSQ